MFQAIPIPLSSRNALACSRACSRVRISAAAACSGDHPNRISGSPVARESHLEDPAQGRARKAPATRTDPGGDSSNGYCYIRIDGKGYLGHRLAWLYMHGHFPDGLLDHKNHNRSSCRIADLREATRSQNSANSRMQRTNRSGFKGARWIKKCNKYRAQIVFRGKAVSPEDTIKRQERLR